MARNPERRRLEEDALPVHNRRQNLPFALENAALHRAAGSEAALGRPENSGRLLPACYQFNRH
jgi:hypothetical protein